jgi:hypothetical protein
VFRNGIAQRTTMPLRACQDSIAARTCRPHQTDGSGAYGDLACTLFGQVIEQLGIDYFVLVVDDVYAPEGRARCAEPVVAEVAGQRVRVVPELAGRAL